MIGSENRDYPLLTRARLAIDLARRHLALGRAMARLRRLSTGCLPNQALLEQLRDGFGNIGWSADLPYLEEVCRAVRATSGSILECGSGATTLLLGVLLAGTDRRVTALEHLPDYLRRVELALERFDLGNVDVLHSPIVSHGAYDWYRKPLLPAETRFGLAICDGPPGTTRGGRFGLPAIMRDTLVDGCLILLDDSHRDSEVEVVRQWQGRFRIKVLRRAARHTVLEFCP
jgi:hypothetical protein